MADIVLKDRNGNDVTYEGIETVTFDTTEEGVQATFTEGVAVEDFEIVPDFTGGDMPIAAPDGTLVKSATIKKPGTLTPENVRNGVEIGGISGSFIGDTEEAEAELSMADGDQVISPSAVGKVLSAVTVKKPETLIPKNIAEGVDIAGIIGTFAGGGDTDGIVSRTATVINLPDTDVGAYAFYEYDNLVSATVRNVGDYGFKDALNLENVVVTGTTLGKEAFYGASKLKTIDVANVTNLGATGQIFRSCSSLEEVVFSAADANYISNGNYNFLNCTALKKVDFHMPVMLNNKSIFSGCSSLTAIIMRGNRVFNVYNSASDTSSNAILYNAPNAKFYVPSAMMESYAANTKWNTYITTGRLLAIEDYPEICG